MTKKKLRSLVKSLKGARALEKLKAGEILSEEEMLLVCKYQIRYGMTYDNLDVFLEKDSSGYTQRLLRILPKYPSLKKHYDLLLEYNKHRGKDSYIKNSGGRL